MLEDHHQPMLIYLLVALGSAFGGAARYLLTLLVTRFVGKDFPWGTLLVNVSGCLVIGLFGVGLILPGDETWLQFLTFGILGGYTTFSSVSLETLYLAQDGRWARSALYVTGSFLICLIATAVGAAIGLQLITG